MVMHLSFDYTNIELQIICNHSSHEVPFDTTFGIYEWLVPKILFWLVNHIVFYY